MSNSITLPASLQAPAPPPNALDTTPGANPTEPVAYYQLSSGHIASLPQSSVPALMKQDPGAKSIPAPQRGQTLVKLSSGHAATLPTTSLAALKQQDPNFTYIAGDTTSLKTMEMTPSFTPSQAVLGSNTAAGAPQSEVTDFRFHAPHVIQGSPLEKMIQVVDPSFQGSLSPADTEARLKKEQAPITNPVVNLSQFESEKNHPIVKALTESAESLTSPANVAILYGTGGLGLVDSPASLAIANRLLSAGFSAAMIGSAYKNLEGFKAAYDRGDWATAEYQLTHAVTSGVLALVAGHGALKDASPAAAVDTVRNVARKANPFRTVEVAGENFATRPMTSGANVEPGTQAVRNVAGQTTAAAGGTPTEAASLRDVWKEPIAAREAEAKSYYKQLDDASNNQWTANQTALKNVRRDIQTRGGVDDDLDQKLNARKIQLEWQQEQILDKLPKGVAEAAKSNWTQKMRLEDLQDIFNKKSNITGPRPEMAAPGVKGLPKEQYNFKGIAKDLNAMDPTDLTQALGSKEAAQQLVSAANLAAKQGWLNSAAMGVFRHALQLAGLGTMAHFIP
jgi:hypothetical protein